MIKACNMSNVLFSLIMHYIFPKAIFCHLSNISILITLAIAGFDLLNYPCCHGRREASSKMVLGVGLCACANRLFIFSHWWQMERELPILDAHGVYSIQMTRRLIFPSYLWFDSQGISIYVWWPVYCFFSQLIHSHSKGCWSLEAAIHQLNA